MLEFSFSNSVVNHPIMQRLFVSTMEHCDQMIDEAMATIKVCDEATMRDRLSLDSTPFVLAKRMRMSFSEITKDNDIRLCFQALLLYLLRRRIPPKYETEESFLEKYPEYADRSPVERTRLRNSANWMVLTFHTIQPRNNKSFIMHLIPKLVEGKNARYITGSGQTKSTADRVHLFRTEGECEKIQRPPRKRKDAMMNESSDDIAALEFATNNSINLNPVLGLASGISESNSGESARNTTSMLPGMDSVAWQLHLRLLQQQQQQQQVVRPSLNPASSLFFSHPLYSAMLAQEALKRNNHNSATNNSASVASNNSVLMANYAAMYASTMQNSAPNFSSPSPASSTVTTPSNLSLATSAAFLYPLQQHTSHDSLSSLTSPPKLLSTSKSASKTKAKKADQSVVASASAARKAATLSRSKSATELQHAMLLASTTAPPLKRAKSTHIDLSAYPMSGHPQNFFYSPLSTATTTSSSSTVSSTGSTQSPYLTSMLIPNASTNLPYYNPNSSNNESFDIMRKGMLQDAHHSSSSMGLDALLSAAECIEELA
jgi:hypothetical protein